MPSLGSSLSSSTVGYRANRNRDSSRRNKKSLVLLFCLYSAACLLPPLQQQGRVGGSCGSNCSFVSAFMTKNPTTTNRYRKYNTATAAFRNNKNNRWSAADGVPIGGGRKRRKPSNNHSVLQRKVSISFPPDEFGNSNESNNDVRKEEDSGFEGILYNLFTDPDVMRLPGSLSQFQNVVAMLMSKIITIIL